MKKLLFFIAIVIIALNYSFIVSAADMPDLSIYTDTEIEELLNLIQTEIVNRKIEKTANLTAGYYIAGKDLPAGTYTLTMKYDGGFWASFSVKSDGGQGEETFSGSVFSIDNKTASVKGEGSWTITLNEGDLLECSNEITLTIFAGVKFF